MKEKSKAFTVKRNLWRLLLLLSCAALRKYNANFMNKKMSLKSLTAGSQYIILVSGFSSPDLTTAWDWTCSQQPVYTSFSS